MKTKNKKKRIAPAFKSFYPVLIMILCLFMGVGYAAVNSVNLTIAGDIIAMELDDVVVTDISYKESSYATLDSSNVSVVSKTVLNSNIALSSTNSNSYITYTVTVLNTNTYDCFYNGAVFDNEFYDNQNIIFELSDNMIEGMFLKAGESLSFDIKFKYKDGVIPNSSNNKLNAYINIDFPAVAVLQATSSGDTSGFRAYKESIKNISFEDKIKEPSNIVDSWDIGVSQTGNVMAYLVTNESDSNYYDLYIQSDTKLYANEDMGYWFYGLKNVDAINGLSLMDTTNTKRMTFMFGLTGQSSSVFTLDVSSFDTSNVTNMSYMFYYTGYNSQEFKLDLRNFDTSNVTNMNSMFRRAGNNDVNFTLDVSSFNTSKVTDMNHMFYSAGFDSTVFELDVSSFDTSNVTDMGYMFSSCGYNSPNFTLDVSNFNTSKVTDMSYMFSSSGRRNKNFNLDVSNFDTSNVTDMSWMFAEMGVNATNFVLDLRNFDTRKVKDMNHMFFYTAYNSSTATLDLSSFDTSNVTNMNSMFRRTAYESSSFELDVSHFKTSEVTDMNHMFYNTGYKSTVLQLDVSGFDTSNVTDMGYMFFNSGYNNPNFTLDVSGFDTSKVVDMSSMFYQTGYYSTKLNIIFNVTNPNTTSYSEMFVAAATKSGAKITVNYTSETSDLVDLMIATKSETSNVVKGTLVS